MPVAGEPRAPDSSDPQPFPLSLQQQSLSTNNSQKPGAAIDLILFASLSCDQLSAWEEAGSGEMEERESCCNIF